MDLSNLHEKMAATGIFHFLEDGGFGAVLGGFTVEECLASSVVLPQGIWYKRKAPRRGSPAAPIHSSA